MSGSEIAALKMNGLVASQSSTVALLIAGTKSKVTLYPLPCVPSYPNRSAGRPFVEREETRVGAGAATAGFFGDACRVGGISGVRGT